MWLVKGRTFYNMPWYGSYHSMMDRCYRKTAKNYKYYGARGIEVCEEWKDIECFERWVHESGYQKGMTLDRIDANGNYEPSNCRWATMKKQCNNRRNTTLVEHNGEVHSISEWADILGIKYSTLANRYRRGDRGERLFEKLRYTRCKD